MNEEQAKGLYKKLFRAFPQYEDWIAEKVKRQLEDGVSLSETTFALWCRMWASVEFFEASRVVDRLIDGRLAMPVAYERDQLPIRVREFAAALVEQRRAAERRSEMRHQYQQSKWANSKAPFNRLHSAREILTRTQELSRQLKCGEIDKETFDAAYAANQSRIKLQI